MLHRLIPYRIDRLLLLGSSTLEHIVPEPWQLQGADPNISHICVAFAGSIDIGLLLRIVLVVLHYKLV